MNPEVGPSWNWQRWEWSLFASGLLLLLALKVDCLEHFGSVIGCWDFWVCFLCCIVANKDTVVSLTHFFFSIFFRKVYCHFSIVKVMSQTHIIFFLPWNNRCGRAWRKLCSVFKIIVGHSLAISPFCTIWSVSSFVWRS